MVCALRLDVRVVCLVPNCQPPPPIPACRLTPHPRWGSPFTRCRRPIYPAVELRRVD
jgi:hypothetical protein